MPAALRESGSALLSSRALIWAAGVCTALIAGPGKLAANSFNHHQLATPFPSTLANLLAAPAPRWDSVWLLGIAHAGYHRADETVFFPVYPAAVAGGGTVLGGGSASNLVAGGAVLLVCGPLAVVL